MLGSDVEPSEQWLIQLPALLIVTTSMVIDRSLRKDLIEERVRCQIWLWFCMILSLRSHYYYHNNNNLKDDNSKDVTIRSEDLICETWMHVTIVSNLASIGALAISSPFERIKKSSNKKTWWFSFAAWTATMASSCLFSSLRYTDGTQESIAMFSLQVYMVSLCILWMIHWHKRRKEKLEQEMRNITGSSITKTTSSFVISQDMDGFDRSKWYTWKPSTTLSWISHVLESSSNYYNNNNGDDDEDIDPGVIQQLASHRIDGPLLDTLTVSQLLQLQVPYGPACHLDQAIQNELIRPFPKPREAEAGMLLPSDHRNAASYNHNSSGEIPTSGSDFLSGFDQEYNNSDRPRNFTPTSASGAEMPSLDPDQQDRIRDTMKERYGLELPRLRTEEGSNNSEPEASPPQQASIPSKKPPPPSLPKVIPPGAAIRLPTQSASSAPGGGLEAELAAGVEIPEAILKQMPPNVQEVAKRRPDLVRQMLLSRQLKVPQQQQQRQREDQLYTHAEEGEHVSLDDGEEDDSSNDETARLIRRKKDHRQYKSTGL